MPPKKNPFPKLCVYRGYCRAKHPHTGKYKSFGKARGARRSGARG